MKFRQNSINQAKELLRELERLKAMREWVLLAGKKYENSVEQEENFEKMQANISVWEKELTRYQAEYQDLIQKSALAEKAGREDIAKNYQLRIESVSSHLNHTKKQVNKLQKVADQIGLIS